jgi:cytochrome bd-type quinol oxidase subunit 2
MCKQKNIKYELVIFIPVYIIITMTICILEICFIYYPKTTLITYINSYFIGTAITTLLCVFISAIRLILSNQKGKCHERVKTAILIILIWLIPIFMFFTFIIFLHQYNKVFVPYWTLVMPCICLFIGIVLILVLHYEQ